MGVALEEPRPDDRRLEVEGLPVALPPDVVLLLEAYPGATLDDEGRGAGEPRFYVRLGRRAWR